MGSPWDSTKVRVLRVYVDARLMKVPGSKLGSWRWDELAENLFAT